MCFASMPKPKKLPPPPNKLDSQADALANMQARRAGGINRQQTNITGGMAGAPNISAPSAGGKSVLGG